MDAVLCSQSEYQRIWEVVALWCPSDEPHTDVVQPVRLYHLLFTLNRIDSTGPTHFIIKHIGVRLSNGQPGQCISLPVQPIGIDWRFNQKLTNPVSGGGSTIAVCPYTSQQYVALQAAAAIIIMERR